MKTNLEKWNYYKAIVDSNTNKFIQEQLKGIKLPTSYFFVYPTGKMVEREILGTHYTFGKEAGRNYYTGKKPTKEDVQQIMSIAAITDFKIEKCWFDYSEIWDEKKGSKSTSAVNFVDVINEKGSNFLDRDKAIKFSEILIAKNKEMEEFYEKHKKTTLYDYHANGYKDLGWQNDWSYVRLDEDGILCSVSGKAQKYVKPDPKLHPEHTQCIEAGHQRIEVSHSVRGTENTVSCPICKVFWKYDCSD
jgi:hypothetical protein